jgi:hypothetical protein
MIDGESDSKPVGFFKKVNNICCIGAGYVGGPSCAVMASKCPHIQINVVDMSQERIDAWNSSNLPIFEVKIFLKCKGSVKFISIHFNLFQFISIHFNFNLFQFIH